MVRPADRRALLSGARVYLCVGWREDLADLLDAVLPSIDIVQLRDKDGDDDRLRAGSAVVAQAAARHSRLFVLNDRPDLAVEVGADGVHLGQDDLPPAAARGIVGPELLIGRSTHSTAEVDRAQVEDCDYFAVGPVAATPTKPGRPGIGLDPVRHAAAVASKPWFVTGNMTPATAPDVVAAGAPGIVVVRALTDAEDPGVVSGLLQAALSDAADQPAPSGPAAR